MEDKRTFLEDLSEEELEKIWADPEFQKQFERDTKEAKARQLKLREAEQNSKASEKNI